MLLPASLRNDPKERGLCRPHLAQLMLALPEDCANGDPEARERYRRPSGLILVVVLSRIPPFCLFSGPKAKVGGKLKPFAGFCPP